VDIRTQIDTAFLAINNGHISFEALAKVFHPRLVREYLVAAIAHCTPPIADFNGEEFPYDIESYTEWLDEFERVYTVEEYPELYI